MKRSIKLSELYYELKYAEQGLEQMQQPDAGYFEDINDKQFHEWQKYNSDVANQCKHIDRLDKAYREEYKRCMEEQ